MAWYKLQQKADTANAVLRTNRRVTSVFKRSSHAHLANTMSLSDILDYARLTLHHHPYGKACLMMLQWNFNVKSFWQIFLIHTQIPGLNIKVHA